jgi:hypothetical protein
MNYLSSPEAAKRRKYQLIEEEILCIVESELLTGNRETVQIAPYVESDFGEMIAKKYPALNVKQVNYIFYISLKPTSPGKKEIVTQGNEKIDIQDKIKVTPEKKDAIMKNAFMKTNDEIMKNHQKKIHENRNDLIMKLRENDQTIYNKVPINNNTIFVEDDLRLARGIHEKMEEIKNNKEEAITKESETIMENKNDLIMTLQENEITKDNDNISQDKKSDGELSAVNYKKNLATFQLNELKQLVFKTPTPIFTLTVTNWNFGSITKENGDELKKYGYWISEFGSGKLQLIWKPIKNMQKNTLIGDQITFDKKMEEFQLNELKKLFIRTPDFIFKLPVPDWKYGTISEANIIETLKFGYKIYDYGNKLSIEWCG